LVEGDANNKRNEQRHPPPKQKRRIVMKSLWGMKLGRKLALTALALCFFAAPGKAQDTRPEAPVCTSYPEWSCETQTVSGPEKTPVRKKYEKKASKLHSENMARVKQSAGDTPALPDEDVRPERFGP
jgi:hypothetical protein